MKNSVLILIYFHTYKHTYFHMYLSLNLFICTSESYYLDLFNLQTTVTKIIAKLLRYENTSCYYILNKCILGTSTKL